MEGRKGFSEIWTEAQRERSEYVWFAISRLMAMPRQKVRQEPEPIDIWNTRNAALAEG
jgi:hypothetical protein